MSEVPLYTQGYHPLGRMQQDLTRGHAHPTGLADKSGTLDRGTLLIKNRRPPPSTTVGP